MADPYHTADGYSDSNPRNNPPNNQSQSLPEYIQSGSEVDKAAQLGMLGLPEIFEKITNLGNKYGQKPEPTSTNDQLQNRPEYIHPGSEVDRAAKLGILGTLEISTKIEILGSTYGEQKCRRKGCEIVVSVTAQYEACDEHQPYYTDWDFAYCETELKMESKSLEICTDPGLFFMNGQCVQKKPFYINMGGYTGNFCTIHKGNHQRNAFYESNGGKDGKWFPGRHEGNVKLPAGYGKSGVPKWKRPNNSKTTNLDAQQEGSSAGQGLE
ncbi:hypothetical protein NHQ30_002580 [Ciborinia camelliae]|nr:hypothetical protein NHQ30_002580 [Ciborinia camelliae]